MIRRCHTTDPFIGDGNQRCGRVIDDVCRSTICPHPPLDGATIHERIVTGEDRVMTNADAGESDT